MKEWYLWRVSPSLESMGKNAAGCVYSIKGACANPRELRWVATLGCLGPPTERAREFHRGTWAWLELGGHLEWRKARFPGTMSTSASAGGPRRPSVWATRAGSVIERQLGLSKLELRVKHGRALWRKRGKSDPFFSFTQQSDILVLLILHKSRLSCLLAGVETRARRDCIELVSK